MKTCTWHSSPPPPHMQDKELVWSCHMAQSDDPAREVCSVEFSIPPPADPRVVQVLHSHLLGSVSFPAVGIPQRQTRRLYISSTHLHEVHAEVDAKDIRRSGWCEACQKPGASGGQERTPEASRHVRKACREQKRTNPLLLSLYCRPSQPVSLVPALSGMTTAVML